MFKIQMQVRDYECDLQGVVNNSVYQNYLEHARHEFLQSIGVDFSKLTAEAVHLVVTRVELDYKASLRPNDQFYVTVALTRESRIKYAFMQNIYRLTDEKLMLQAKTLGVALNPKGRPITFEVFDRLLS